MNSLSLKKIGGLLLFSLCFASGVGAQSVPPTPLPPNPLVKPEQQPITINWNYTAPWKSDTTATPTIDQGSAFFLPWIGKNVMGLMNYADFFYQLEKNNVNGSITGAYDTAGTMKGNNQLSQKQTANLATVNKITSEQFQTLLSYDPKIKLEPMQRYAELPGTDITLSCQSTANCNDTPFNASSLFDVTGFDDPNNKNLPTNDNINALIYFLANLSIQFPDPGFDKNDSPDSRAAFIDKGEVQQYILAVRSLSALQSMALSNFNLLAQERRIIPGLGKDADVKIFPPLPANPKDPIPPPTKVENASQLQVEKYLIDRRLNNPQWYAEMNTATPVALQRETLFALVEMQRQIYELRMINERMLATLSTMQMAMLQLSLPQLQVQAQKISNPQTYTTNNPPKQP